MNEIKNGVVYCDPPIKEDLFNFLLSHLDCDCAFRRHNMSDPVVEIVAYASSGSANNALRDAFENNSTVNIMNGLSSQGINEID